MTAPKDSFVTVGALNIRYHEAGTGDAILCLHGGGPGASGYSNFSRNVEALSSSFRLILVDLPGYGQSDKPRIEQPLNSYYAGFARDFLDALGIERAHLLGNSLGGGACIKFAIDWPDRVDRLVLMGPGGGIALHSAVGPSEGIRHLVNFYEGEGPTRAKFEAFLKLMVFDPAMLTEQLIEDRFAAATQPGVAENFPLRVANMKLPYEPLWARLAAVKAPTLLVWGRDDRTNTIDNAYIMLHQIPDIRLHVFARCGHWAQWEKADEFNRLVLDFLSAPDRHSA